MKKILLVLIVVISVGTLYPRNHLNIGELVTSSNENTSSIELKATAADQSITIISDIKEPMLIKIMDESGFIRIQKNLHQDREIDITSLLEGLYVMKVSVGNRIELKRFYKGKDGVDVR
ncbi:T9SS type A sorting domain-containing protein [Aquimarina litoralis]|uniref:T9SS type A sorting domain-containing protein n=1 Tax=Aquimarina litoralis TaxID=584605 RepID=UPI001C55BA99|nr:T9SS type A sorting domain-containing protein [Aquimarina litoralis]MBW1298232.1 T9SS type A sorting domain-containing protein [Aquimarina litoralis]